MRLALSLKERTAPAHVIVQRLRNSYPSDRLSKAITNLGRVIKTEYILLYLTDAELRRTVRASAQQRGKAPAPDLVRRPRRVHHRGLRGDCEQGQLPQAKAPAPDLVRRPRRVHHRGLRGDCEQGQLPQLGFQRHSVLESTPPYGGRPAGGTIKIAETVGRLRAHGEDISDETLSHVSLLPFRHVLPNGTYFIENS